MERITKGMLEGLAALINKTAGTPATEYTKVDDKYKANPDNYHLTYAYGGANLCQVCSDGHGERNVLGCGHVPKRDLYNRMRAFLEGLYAGKAYQSHKQSVSHERQNTRILCPSCQTLKGDEQTCPHCGCPDETKRLGELSSN